ncbi:MAG: sulfotransferase family protein [Primorskyibacter sp.]
MGFPGTWMTLSESTIYRVVPKCACSTIGQILYYSDHGRFFDGDIHDAQDGLHKWGFDQSQPHIRRNVGARTFAFTCVRNPYDRVLSSFFDKICAIQRNGRRYRENTLPKMMRRYGVDLGKPDFDQIAAFRRFLVFTRDTVRFRRPMDPDIHWSPMASHIGTFVANGGRFDAILRTEDFGPGMDAVLSQINTPVTVDLAAVPRFNDSGDQGAKRAHPVADYFDDLSMYLVQDMYKKDFALFGYDRDAPGTKTPRSEIDLDAVHAKLAA